MDEAKGERKGRDNAGAVKSGVEDLVSLSESGALSVVASLCSGQLAFLCTLRARVCKEAVSRYGKQDMLVEDTRCLFLLALTSDGLVWSSKGEIFSCCGEYMGIVSVGKDGRGWDVDGRDSAQLRFIDVYCRISSRA